MNRLSAEAWAGQSAQSNTTTQTTFNLIAYPSLLPLGLLGSSRSGCLRDQRFLSKLASSGLPVSTPASDPRCSQTNTFAQASILLAGFRHTLNGKAPFSPFSPRSTLTLHTAVHWPCTPKT